MNKNPIFTIARREFISFINSATGYLIISVFLGLSMFLQWQTALISGEASMTEFFNIWPWFAMILVPALTMRSLSEEKNNQTLDLTLSHPINEWQVVIGKFWGSWMFLILIMASTLPTAATLAAFSRFDWGLVSSQYLGAILMGGVFVALGILISSYTENLISSFLATAAVIFIWILIGLQYISMIFPSNLSNLIQEVSITLRIEAFNRGLISFKEVTFMVIVAGLFIMLATIRLMATKTAENSALRSKLFISTVMMLIIGVVGYLTLSSLRLQLDFTRNQSASLTAGTKQTLQNLDDIVAINFYTSMELPGQYAFTKRYTENLLDEYVSQSRGKVKQSIKNPDQNQDLAQEAIQSGIQPQSMATIQQTKFQSEQGYLGLTISYGGKSEAIGFIQDPQNLEYEITRRIRKLTSPKSQELGIISNLSSLDPSRDYGLLAQYLGSQYSLVEINLITDSNKLASISAALIVAPIEQPDSTSSASLKQYLNNGGRIMLMLDRVEPNIQIGSATIKSNDWSEILKDYGISVNPDMVYDIAQNESITLGSNGPISYAINYPYWIKASTNHDVPSVNAVQTISMAWPSSVTLSNVEGVTQTVLLKTSDDAGANTSNLVISPDNLPKASQNQSYNLAVSAEKGNSRMVVIGDSDLAIDQFTRFKGPNVAFISNLVDWLTSDGSQLPVPLRDFSPAILQFSDPSLQIPLARWGNVLGGAVLVAAIGAWHLQRRQSLTNRKWFSSLKNER